MIGSQPNAVHWLEQLTRATAAAHGEISLFIDSSGPPIQYAAGDADTTHVSSSGDVRHMSVG